MKGTETPNLLPTVRRLIAIRFTETCDNTFVDICLYDRAESETLSNYFSSEKANLDSRSIFSYSPAMFLSRDRYSKQTRASGLRIILHGFNDVIGR